MADASCSAAALRAFSTWARACAPSADRSTAWQYAHRHSQTRQTQDCDLGLQAVCQLSQQNAEQADALLEYQSSVST